MIHQAYCDHFKYGDKSASLTRIMKVCSNDKGELDGWARENVTAISDTSCGPTQATTPTEERRSGIKSAAVAPYSAIPVLM